MVCIKNTKIIFELFIFCLYFVSAYRIKSRLQQNDGSQHVRSTTRYFSSSDSNEKYKFESSQSNTPFEDDIEKTCLALKDSIEVRLSNSKATYIQITIFTDQTVSREEEAETIILNNQELQDEIRRKYIDLGDYFSFTRCDIYIFNDSFFIIPDAQTGVESNLNDLFRNYIKLPKEYNEINDLFEIDEIVAYTKIEMHYYLDSEGIKVIMNDFYANTENKNGNYRIGYAQLEMTSIKICRPYFSDNTIISYQGNLNFYNNESNISDQSIENYLVPIKTDVNKTWVESKFDVQNAYFEWTLMPNKNQITVSTLIQLLDSELANDSKNENYEGKSLINIAIPPPKGVSSIVDYFDDWAFIVSQKRSLVYVEIQFKISSFNFLPLEVESSSNNCYINYTDSTNVYIKIDGITILDSSVFDSEFLKISSLTDYNITLRSVKESEMSFYTIKKYLIPSIQISSGNILTTDNYSLEQLSKFGISEDDTLIHEPIILILQDELYTYEIIGSMQYLNDVNSWISLNIELANLDGYVLSHINFYFPSTQSENAYQKLFGSNDGDSGFNSLKIVDFQLTSVNRDFNLETIEFADNKKTLSIVDNNNVLKDGITVIVETMMQNNCLEYTFCNFMNNLHIQNAFNFTGLLTEHTVLSTDVESFVLNNTFVFRENKLLIYPNSLYSTLKMSCNMEFPVDPFTKRTFVSEISFGSETNDLLTLKGNELGVYSEIFGIPLLDFITNKVTLYINEFGYILNQNILSSSLLGTNCYERMDLLVSLQESEDNIGDQAYDFSINDSSYNVNKGVNVITDKCMIGYNNLYTFQDLSKSYFTGNYQLDSLNSLCKAIYNSVDEKLPYIIHKISYPFGISLKYNYQDAKKIIPLRFYSEMNFLGILSKGEIDINLENYNISLKMALPSFEVGGGNLQFMTKDDFKNYYGEEDGSCNTKRFDSHISCSDFDKNNTISTTITNDIISQAELEFSSNALLFGVLFRYITNITGEKLDVSIQGRPFRGSFQANISASVPLVSDIRNEINSLYTLDLISENNLKELEREINLRLQKWMNTIIYADINIKQTRESLINQLSKSYEDKTKSLHCDNVEVCTELPSIKCSQYAVNARCKQTANVCKAMTQQCTDMRIDCTRTGEDGKCYEQVYACTKWENVCEDEDMTTVCIAYDEQIIPNRCIQMELSCSKLNVEDEACRNKQKEIQDNIDDLEKELNELKRWETIMGELVDSCICSINVKDKSKRNNLKSCTEKESTLDDYTEKIDLFEIFTLQKSRSLSKLIDIVSSDDMVFKTDLILYGDWSSNQYGNKSSIENNPIPKNYQQKDGYDLSSYSSLSINHTLDFKNVNQSSYIIFKKLNQVLCKEFGIDHSKASDVQWMLREYSYVDGNETICSIVPQSKNQGITNVNIFEYPQGSIFKTNEYDRYINKEQFTNLIYHNSQSTVQENTNSNVVANSKENQELENEINDSNTVNSQKDLKEINNDEITPDIYSSKSEENDNKEMLEEIDLDISNKESSKEVKEKSTEVETDVPTELNFEESIDVSIDESTEKSNENNMNGSFQDGRSQIFSEKEIISEPYYNELSVENMNKNELPYEYIIKEPDDKYSTFDSLTSINNKNTVNNFNEENPLTEENIFTNDKNIKESNYNNIKKSSDNILDEENNNTNEINYDRDISLSYYSGSIDISFNVLHYENKELNNPVNDLKSRITDLRREVHDSFKQQINNNIEKVNSIREKVENKVYQNIERAEQNIEKVEQNIEKVEHNILNRLRKRY